MTPFGTRPTYLLPEELLGDAALGLVLPVALLLDEPPEPGRDEIEHNHDDCALVPKLNPELTVDRKVEELDAPCSQTTHTRKPTHSPPRKADVTA